MKNLLLKTENVVKTFRVIGHKKKKIVGSYEQINRLSGLWRAT